MNPLLGKYIRIIEENLNNHEVYFVYPSEIAASFWRGKSLTLGNTKAVFTDRFLSWDKFKENYFALNQKGTPVNKSIRTLFALSFLEKNTGVKALLKHLVPPPYRENSRAFKNLLLSILPGLPEIMDVVRGDKGSIPPLLKGDFNLLYSEYTSFLNKWNLFEPGWMRGNIRDIQGTFHIFFPDVIDDFKQFEGELSRLENIFFHETSDEGNSGITRFETAPLEIKWLLGQIRDLLKAGTQVDEIAVTLPDSGEWSYRLKSAAEDRGIPLSFKGGKALSEYPGALFFRKMRDCVTSGFSLGSMKQLLLDSAVPWKDKEAARALVSFGIEHHCHKNHYYRGREKDLWLDALERNQVKDGSGPDLYNFYLKFKKSLTGVVRTLTFDETRIELQKFIAAFIDTSSLDTVTTLREFQFALDVLKDLAVTVRKFKGIAVSSPYEMWLSLLDDTLYVPKGEESGIPVYPYRVSGGICPGWHFIPGCSQKSSSVLKNDFPFLREDYKDGLLAERDFTVPFLNLYKDSGEKVIFSMSRESFSGPEIPPGSFVDEGRVEDWGGDILSLNDQFDVEKLLWKGMKVSLPYGAAILAEGMNRAVISVFKKKKVDFTRECVSDPDLRSEIYSRFLTESGKIKTSSTMLDNYYFCPYSFFLQRGLSIDSIQHETVFKDHALIGSIIHACFYQLFEGIRKSTGTFNPDLKGEYLGKIPEVVKNVFYRFENSGKSLLPPVWEETKSFVTNHLVRFIDVESDMFPGYIPDSLEETCRMEFDGVSLEGRIDRISSRDGSRYLIDYKKGSTPKVSDLFPPEGLPSSFQMFFYILLAESSGERITSALYYSFTQDKYVRIYSEPPGRGERGRDEVNERILEMKGSIMEMKENIEKGNFKVSECNSCDFRNICRTRYTVR